MPDHEKQGCPPQSGPTIRAFFAIALINTVRSELNNIINELHLRKGGDRVRWVRAENLHVTLHFLGNIASDIVPDLLNKVALELEDEEIFTCHLTSLDLFPSAKRPRVIALRLGSEKYLIELSDAIKRGVSAFGLPSDPRPFKAHLTLGRLPGTTYPSTKNVSLDGNTPITVSEVLLYQSELHPDGPLYKERGMIKLGAGKK